MKDIFNKLNSDLLNNFHDKYLKNLLNLTYIIKECRYYIYVIEFKTLIYVWSMEK
jgi:hypothetical protein